MKTNDNRATQTNKRTVRQYIHYNCPYESILLMARKLYNKKLLFMFYISLNGLDELFSSL